MVYGVEPDLTREGGSIPVTLTLQEATGKNVILLPMGASDDGAHSQNEKIDVRNYIEGTKLLGAYAYQLSQLWFVTKQWLKEIKALLSLQNFNHTSKEKK